MKLKSRRIISVALFGLVMLSCAIMAIAAYPSNYGLAPSKRVTVDVGDEADVLGTSFPNARNSVMLPNGARHVVYSTTGETKNQILYATSRDGGDSWVNNKVIYDGAAANTVAFPTVAVNSSNVMFVAFYCLNASGESDIWVTINTDGSWAVPTPIYTPGWNDTIPAIAIDADDVVHLVWQAYNKTSTYRTILYANNTDWSNVIAFRGSLIHEEAPGEGEQSNYLKHFLYPSIATNSTNGIWVSYHWYNQSVGEYYRVGVANYNGVTRSFNDTVGSNQTRNACISIASNDTVWLSMKYYETDTEPGWTNLTVVWFDDYSDLTGPPARVFTEITIASWVNSSTWLYPSIALDSADNVLTSAIPTLWGDWSFLVWYIYDTSENDVAQNGSHPNAVEGEDPGQIAMFTNHRWSTENNPAADKGDTVFTEFTGDLNTMVRFANTWSSGGSGSSGEIGENVERVLEVWTPILLILALMGVGLTYLGWSAYRD